MEIDSKVNIAVFVSLFGFGFTIYSSFVQNRRRKIEAYEKAYDDSCFLLMYSYNKYMGMINEQNYKNTDKNLEDAVRKYLTLHWIEQTWEYDKYVPASLIDIKEKVKYSFLVSSEARSFIQQKEEYCFTEAGRERSPIFHLESDEFSRRFNNVMDTVGKNLSLFDKEIRYLWERAKTTNIYSLKQEYKQLDALDKNVIEDLKLDEAVFDPFYLLLFNIRKDYRQLTKSRADKLGELWLKLYYRYFFFLFKKRRLRGLNRR